MFGATLALAMIYRRLERIQTVDGWHDEHPFHCTGCKGLAHHEFKTWIDIQRGTLNGNYTQAALALGMTP